MTNNSDKLRGVFQNIYTPDVGYDELKRAYAKAAASLKLSGCSSCQINSSFRRFMLQMTGDTNTLLNSKPVTMPVKKATKKKATTKKTVTKKTTVTKNKPKVTVVKKMTSVEKEKNTTKLPGGVRFLYIPKRK